MDKPTILIQLDTDPQPSAFDRVVAIDAGVQHLFSYGGVTPDAVMPLVHGCIFTRGPKDLAKTAIFIGGSDVTAGETLLAEVRKHLLPLFGLSVSVMLDSNGANTTAAAAVIAASRHLDLKTCKSLVLGSTGPVGQRVARLLAAAGGHVRIGSRSQEKAEVVAAAIRKAVPTANVEGVASSSSTDAPTALDGRELVVAAGAPGAMMLPLKYRAACKSLLVTIDLNGVPPAGIEGVELNDKASNRNDCLCYGALGVGGTKMKIHKAAVAELFKRNDQVFDIEQVFQLGKSLGL
ncbi:MAG: methylenetetrahydromethanopterin dehydrogenase [Fimbriiglobus sp.]|nr:methylenetetrahydromethanopterin dehydrogenase [Fimbriiglobus sp.]